MKCTTIGAGLALACALVFGSAREASAAAIAQTRSVTLYEPIGTAWEIRDTALLQDRIRLAKNTGFNAVWLIVEWDKLDSTPSSTGDIAPADCAVGANAGLYQCAVERAMALTRQEGVDLFLSLNYAGGDAPASFTSSVDPVMLPYGDAQAKFYRYARFVARLALRNGVPDSTRFLFHDEGILGPYRSLRSYRDAQQRFRDYLFGINTSLAFWNSRWGRTGANAFATWADVKTFEFETQGWRDPQLQDHVAWVNWTLKRSLTGGGFEQAIRSVIPGATVGFHATYFSMIDPAGPASYRPQSPFGAYSSFDFVSVPYYDGPNGFGMAFETYVDTARNFFPGRQLFMGELGSQYCMAGESDCALRPTGYWISDRVRQRQAAFFWQSIQSLRARSVGFNAWNLNDFPFASGQGSFGIYESSYQQASTAARPTFKPAACAIRTQLSSTDPATCLSFGGVNTAYVPRAIWLMGRGIAGGMHARVTSADGTVTAPQDIPLTVGSAENASFQVADAVLAQLGCGAATTGCSIGVEAVGAAGGSNRVLVQVN